MGQLSCKWTLRSSSLLSHKTAGSDLTDPRMRRPRFELGSSRWQRDILTTVLPALGKARDISYLKFTLRHLPARIGRSKDCQRFLDVCLVERQLTCRLERGWRLGREENFDRIYFLARILYIIDLILRFRKLLRNSALLLEMALWLVFGELPKVFLLEVQFFVGPQRLGVDPENK